MLVRGYYSAGIVYLIFAVFYIVCFISWIPRIPFSVLMLQTVIDVSKNYGHVFIVSLVGGIAATAFAAYFSVTMVAIYFKYYPGSPGCDASGAGSCSKGKVIGLLVFITFAGYWITEVLKNVIHVSISGVYGSWYFCANKPGGFPKGATRGAFKRSVTYSFGSISFGSLLVALIQCLRQACSIAQQNEAAQGNILGSIFFCVLQCFIGLLDWAIQFINEYAFSYIALYGKAYIPAAKVRSLPCLKSKAKFSGNMDNDEKPRRRRPRQRMPHQSRPHHGRSLRSLPLLFPRLLIPRVHQTRLQYRQRFHGCHYGICILDWSADC